MPINARIGEMRERITIQSKGTPTRDAAGGEVITWSDVATVWAKEVPYSGREFMSTARENAELFTRFSIRWRSGIAPTMRVSKDSGARLFDILSVTNVNDRNREILLVCQELIDE